MGVGLVEGESGWRGCVVVGGLLVWRGWRCGCEVLCAVVMRKGLFFERGDAQVSTLKMPD